MPSTKIHKKDAMALVAIAALLAPLALLVFRRLDDNSLARWQWIFSRQNEATLIGLILCVLPLAWLCARFYRDRYQPTILLLLSFGLSSCFWAEPEVLLDAARYFYQADQFKRYGFSFFFREWGGNIFAWTDMPLMSLLYGMIFKYVGESRLFVQFFITTLFSSTVLLTYALGRILWNKEVGFCGGLLLLGFPYLYTQVPLLLVDVPTMFFLTLVIFSFVRALQVGAQWMYVFGPTALFAAFFVKFSTWLLLTVVPVIFFVFLKEAPREILKRAALVLLISLLVVGLAVASKHEVLASQIRFILEYQKPGLGRWCESFFSTFFFQIHPFVTLAAMVSLLLALIKRDLKYFVICYLVLLMFFLQVQRIRYFLPVFPMLALMASYAVQEIREREVRRFVVFCALFSSFIIAWAGYLPFLQGMSAVNIKNAGSFLDTIAGDSVRVVSLREDEAIVNPVVSVLLLDLHTRKTVVSDPIQVNSDDLERARESSLRFTWEQPLPEYYVPLLFNDTEDTALVIISPSPAPVLDPSLLQRTTFYRGKRIFQQTTGIFQHQTFVTVYYN